MPEGIWVSYELKTSKFRNDKEKNVKLFKKEGECSMFPSEKKCKLEDYWEGCFTIHILWTSI